MEAKGKPFLYNYKINKATSWDAPSVLFESKNKKPFFSERTKQFLIQLDSVNNTSKKYLTRNFNSATRGCVVKLCLEKQLFMKNQNLHFDLVNGWSEETHSQNSV